MPKFTLARFAECEVFFATWDAPKRGDKVGLTLTERGMEVCYSHDQPCDCGETRGTCYTPQPILDRMLRQVRDDDGQPEPPAGPMDSDLTMGGPDQ